MLKLIQRTFILKELPESVSSRTTTRLFSRWTLRVNSAPTEAPGETSTHICHRHYTLEHVLLSDYRHSGDVARSAARPDQRRTPARASGHQPVQEVKTERSLMISSPPPYVFLRGVRRQSVSSPLTCEETERHCGTLGSVMGSQSTRSNCRGAFRNSTQCSWIPV